MREILFRGKTPDREWFEGYYCPCCFGYFPCRPSIVSKEKIEKGCWKPEEVIPETVGQFTGLYDNTKWEDLTDAEKLKFYRKNYIGEDGMSVRFQKVDDVKFLWKGKPIFEGDIIFFEDESPTNYEYHDCTEMRCGEIKFDDGQFYLTNRIAVEMGDLIYDGMLDGKIIGNIHDNPELLKGAEE